MNNDLLYYLLEKTYFPVQLHAMIDEVAGKLNRNNIDVTYLVKTLKNILHIYKSNNK